MKLVLKRIVRESDIPGGFALHTEDGVALPCQVSTSMTSAGQQPVQLTVVFTVNGRDLIVEGDPV